MRHAKIFFQDQFAGTLDETEGGYRFTYEPTYLKSQNPQAISLSLPLSETPYQSSILFPFFQGLIPEGWYLDIVSRTLKVDAEDRFGLLLATGSHTIGAVSVQAVD